MSGTDATTCKVCGGPFAEKRIVIDGEQYHERCALMSYPPHTHADYARLSAENAELRSQLEQANEELAAARAQVTIAKNSNGFTLLAEQEAEKLRSQLVKEREFRTWVETWTSQPVGAFSVSALDGLFGMTRDKISALTDETNNQETKR